jgi:3-oxoacyl-[acyl-carrier protein] reductase
MTDQLSLDGKVAIVTGAGAGLGRAEALALARAGASVVVNDVANDTAPNDVVDEIEALGSKALLVTGDVAERSTADALLRAATEHFGGLHIVVNNAGVVRDRMLFNMTDEEWDTVIRVHLRGHFLLSRNAAAYWRGQVKATGEPAYARLINTSSEAGLTGSEGQPNYAAAKAGIAAFTMVSAMELKRYGIRCNAIAPFARTRMTLSTPGMDQVVAAPEDAGKFDYWDPANISPLVGYLATADCPFNGGVFHVGGGQVGLYVNWTIDQVIDHGDRWTVEDLIAQAPSLMAGRPKLASAGLDMGDLMKGAF